jgi:hypothetical protein
MRRHCRGHGQISIGWKLSPARTRRDFGRAGFAVHIGQSGRFDPAAKSTEDRDSGSQSLPGSVAALSPNEGRLAFFWRCSFVLRPSKSNCAAPAARLAPAVRLGGEPDGSMRRRLSGGLGHLALPPGLIAAPDPA